MWGGVDLNVREAAGVVYFSLLYNYIYTTCTFSFTLALDAIFQPSIQKLDGVVDSIENIVSNTYNIIFHDK